MLFSRKKTPVPESGDLPGPYPAYPRELLEATLRVPDFGDAHGELLDLELILFDELLRFAVENPVDWTAK